MKQAVIRPQWRPSGSLLLPAALGCDVTISGSGPVAQSVEQRIENPCVGGSIPPQATRDISKTTFGWFFHGRLAQVPQLEVLVITGLRVGNRQRHAVSTIQKASPKQVCAHEGPQAMP